MTGYELLRKLNENPEFLEREVYFTIYCDNVEGIDDFHQLRVDDISFIEDCIDPNTSVPYYIELSTDME